MSIYAMIVTKEMLMLMHEEYMYDRSLSRLEFRELDHSWINVDVKT